MLGSGDDEEASFAIGSGVDAASGNGGVDEKDLFSKSDDASIGERGDGSVIPHSYVRSWSGDGTAHDNRMDTTGTSEIASAMAKSSWMVDDMASSYRSWSSRGNTPSERFEHQVLEESQAIDVDELDMASSSNDSWHSDSKPPRQVRSSDGRSGLSHDSLTHGDHKRDVDVGSGEDEEASFAIGSGVDVASGNGGVDEKDLFSKSDDAQYWGTR
jgi:hypothetical protein